MAGNAKAAGLLHNGQAPAPSMQQSCEEACIVMPAGPTTASGSASTARFQPLKSGGEKDKNKAKQTQNDKGAE